MPNQRAYSDARKESLVSVIETLRKDFSTLSQDAPKRADMCKLELDEVIELIVYQQGYTSLINITSHLWQGADFQEILPQITKRYNKSASLMDVNLQSDLKQSRYAKKDGTISVYEDVLKILKIMERDFDLNYTGPDQKTIDQLASKNKKTSPEMANDIKTLYQKTMTAMVKELRQFITDEKDNYIAKIPKPPRPPSTHYWPQKKN